MLVNNVKTSNIFSFRMLLVCEEFGLLIPATNSVVTHLDAVKASRRKNTCYFLASFLLVRKEEEFFLRNSEN